MTSKWEKKAQEIVLLWSSGRGLTLKHGGISLVTYISKALQAAEEDGLERAAKIAELFKIDDEYSCHWQYGFQMACAEIAKAIRKSESK